MEAFELLGGDQDETRQLVSLANGYSIQVTGHPRVTTVPPGGGKFDIAIALEDLPLTQAFRIDKIPAGRPAQDLATSFVEAFRTQRGANRDAAVERLPRAYPDVIAGACVTYPRKGTAVPVTEQVWVMMRAAPDGYRALFHVVWFETERVTAEQWAKLRAQWVDGHNWTGDPSRAAAAPALQRATQFGLTGADGDETRLLRSADLGYSIALAGRPRIVAAPAGAMTYDVVVALDDIKATHAFRVDDLPAGQEPRALAMAVATSYRDQRAKDQTAPVKLLPWTVPGAVAGAQCVYPRRDVETPTIEHVWIILHTSPAGLRAVVHSTWFANDDVNALQWAHLRASFIDQHAWDGKPRDATPEIWPPSELTVPSAMLGLTPAGWALADALKDEVGHLTTEQMLGIAAILLEYSQSNLSPRAPAPEMVLDNIRRAMRQHGPAQAVDACLASLDRCQTRHDLRGWAWMCTWALGSRAELRAR